MAKSAWDPCPGRGKPPNSGHAPDADYLKCLLCGAALGGSRSHRVPRKNAIEIKEAQDPTRIDPDEGDYYSS